MSLRSSWKLAVVVVGASLVGGCAPTRIAFVPLWSHTLRVGADQDTDVVWLVKATGEGNEYKETVYRCYNSTQGPACAPARVP